VSEAVEELVDETTEVFRAEVRRHRGILNEIVWERIRQDLKWGVVQEGTLDRRQNILGEEVGEACKAILEDDIANLREEWVQIAAVCVANIEALDRGVLST
jgi:hypothetical protein